MWEPPVPPPPPPPPSWDTPTDPGLGRIPPWASTSASPTPAPPTTASPTPAPPPYRHDPWSDPYYTGDQHQPAPYPPPVNPNHDSGYHPSLLDLRPAPESETTHEARSRTVTAVIGLAVLALLAGATILAVTTFSGNHHRPDASTTPHSASSPAAPTTTPTTRRPVTTNPPTPIPAGQVAATTVSTDIARSVAARKLIGPANNDIGDCRATVADVRALDRAATIRTGLVTELARLDVHTLAGGPAAVALLRTAWTYSARADAAYAAWGRHHLGCTGVAKTKGDRDWTRARHNDTLATATKTVAVRLWNPIARRYHLPTRTSGTI